MPKARKTQISLDATSTYHCVSRCVRRAFLCGRDELTGKCFEHRRQLIEDDLLRLSGVFFIDIAAYAIMSNHYHVVLHVNEAEARNADGKTIVERWHQIHNGTEVTKKYLNNEPLETHEREQVDTLIDSWRQRLHSISWFMREVNEKIARLANKEDDCTGRFWEGRFKCQALLDEQAVLSCMAYVDLNPIRASMAKTPEDSAYTSIRKRTRHWRESQSSAKEEDTASPFQPDQLYRFAGNPREPMPEGLPYACLDYLELVDWTGRQVREDKRGSINENAPPILKRLGISAKHWLYLCTHFESRFKGLVGSVESLKQACGHYKRCRVPNAANSRLLFG